ncbi:nitroreductase family deazaflavin-dependent oxidoreductase [Actinopolymorpha pittospori]|uniref:Deazaflavin-dependent oxidoreductase (Nitroreductase family) n=1 Tax=Actinopolymorpha pittospori TaxID=648752 RepID=A0A927MUD3_9ACTN|nr:nitroreductase family deazaflavin-dependent oxidoreductase [Actinopolymorpha pittospori]MBE1606804.1 deazaflavin-dependent oxidoreductase (nitroreductase family) [Actinopolymorpha pittospori]
MVLSKGLARFNRVVTNRITGRIAGWAPGFGFVVHEGRRSGRRYRTPVNVFRRGDGYVVALTYGPTTDWVKNVLAAGGCELTTRGRTVRLRAPRIVHDERRDDMPAVVKVILTRVGVSDFLYLRRADG